MKKVFVRAVRFHRNPIISPLSSETLGNNINGPSLIRVPDWLPNPLGKYYLYFAHHKGTFIRLAFADNLEGPWDIYEPGTLAIENTSCERHIASPDLQVDNEKKELRMYFHGPVPGPGKQSSFVSFSKDGLHFRASHEILGNSYFRLFRWGSHVYAMGGRGVLHRSADGISNFEPGPNPFDRLFFKSRIRHVAVLVRGRTLFVFYSRKGDMPESILLSTIFLGPDWKKWRASKPKTVLTPEKDYEGVFLPLEPSRKGWAPQPVRQVRDPAVFCETGKVFLLYSVAGEQGIALAEIQGLPDDGVF